MSHSAIESPRVSLSRRRNGRVKSACETPVLIEEIPDIALSKSRLARPPVRNANQKRLISHLPGRSRMSVLAFGRCGRTVRMIFTIGGARGSLSLSLSLRSLSLFLTARTNFLSHNVIMRLALAARARARLRGVVGRVLPRKRRRRHLGVTYGHEFTSFVRHSTLFCVFVPRNVLVVSREMTARS